MAHWDALLPGRVLHVPYEQLVEDQEGWSRRLLQHCGLPWDDRVLDFHKTERDVQTASLGQASKSLSPSNASGTPRPRKQNARRGDPRKAYCCKVSQTYMRSNAIPLCQDEEYKCALQLSYSIPYS